MLRNYPPTQLFLISLLVLVYVTPLVSGYFAAVLVSLKFIGKVVCGLLLFSTIVIDIVDGANSRNLGHRH